ncbi:MAG: D-arabinono-1,4-lactone oxidase [Acidimicrobiales bacterium]
MVSWSNWSQSETCSPAQLHFARSVDDISAVVAEAADAAMPVRVAGSGHSHYRLVPTDGVVLDLSGLTGVISADREQGRARVWAGTTIYALGRPLHDAGLALRNQGDIDRQAIAGAIGTGTHGTGLRLSNLTSAVVGMTLVTAGGGVVRCSSTEHAELFHAARLGLGAFGVVTELELDLEPAYRLAETSWRASYDDLRPQIDDLSEAHRHFEFFWYADTDLAHAKSMDITERRAVYPVAGEGERCNWSYEVLPNHRPHLHTEMEYAVPVETSLECLDEIRSLMRGEFSEVRWPVEYRRVAADDVWLSQAYGRTVATISVHQGIGLPAEPFFRACEQIFLRYDGRPHWGKVHYLDGARLAERHPRWDDWWRARDAVDPDGVFLNDRLRSWRS